MLTATITLKPSSGAENEVLHHIIICNDATGTPEEGNYWYTITTPQTLFAEFDIKRGTVKNWPRKERTALQLLKHILITEEI